MLGLSAYRQLVATAPRPTEEQCTDFVRYVATAHSWYKHLPYRLPGVPLVFYIDPFAGCDAVREGGATRLVPRESQGFHYSALPTMDYRRRFGHLSLPESRRHTRQRHECRRDGVTRRRPRRHQ
jgi:hypothetical protein